MRSFHRCLPGAVSAADLFKEELGFFKDDDSNKLAMYIIDHYRDSRHPLGQSELYDQIAEGSPCAICF